MNKNTFVDGYRKNTHCLACGDASLRTLLDLGNQPLANSYHTGELQQKYPLKLNVCTKCHHLQQSHTVDPDLMFKDYLYVSGTTNTLKLYFDDFAKRTLEYYPKAKNILDIACNDGTQLDSYKKIGLATHGIDPAKNLFETSSSKGHQVICDYLTHDVATKLDKKFDIITAQNVFAHTSEPLEFLEACKVLLDDKGLLFIQTSQANMVVNNEFDTVYHEHISFFNTFSMKLLVERAGLRLFDVFKTDIHGTSYVFVITKNNSLNENQGVKLNLDSENDQKLHSMVTYGDYVSKCYRAAFELKDKLKELKEAGYSIIGYGAAAKGNTLLNFAQIDLDLIIDDNPLKQNLLTPGQNIVIKSVEILNSFDKDSKVAFVPLAWNFFEEIKARVKKVRDVDSDIFIKYFPKLYTTK